MKKYNFLWLLLLFCAGCIDENAYSVVKYMANVPRGESRTVTLEEVVSLYPDTRHKLKMEHLFYRAAAVQLKAELYEKFYGESKLSPAEKNKVLKITANLLAERAICNSELASALRLPPDTELQTDLSQWNRKQEVNFTEKELRSVLLLKSADRSVYPLSPRLRPLELELRRRYIALRQAEELLKIAVETLNITPQTDNFASCAAKAALIDAELNVKIAAISILEILDEKDFSAVPAHLKRLEKERVRFEKAARTRKNK